MLPGYPGSQRKTTSGTRPQEKTITISIEGMEERMRFRLLDKAGLPFTAYYPQDMIAETATSKKGTVVRFIANSGGKRNDKAALHIFFFRQGVTQKDAYATMRAAVTSQGIRNPRPLVKPQFPWSLREYSLSAQERGGLAALGSHKGRYFTILLKYPIEYEEGLWPRVEQILEEWRWRDTGRGLNLKG
jgi:hypothetical protein